MVQPEEFVLDFKAEEKRAQSSFYEFEDTLSDTSTITASEMSFRSNSPTPPLFCKLRKPRVMIKKLPKQILKKYNLKCKKSKSYSTKPSRVSKRVGEKKVPGRYLSLHVNKPLNEVLKPKNKHFLYTNKPATKVNEIKPTHTSELSSVARRKHKKFSEMTSRESRPTTRSSLNAASTSNKNSHPIEKRDSKSHKSSRINSTAGSSSASKSKLTLHERIAATRKISENCYLNTPVATTANYCSRAIPTNQPALTSQDSTHYVNKQVCMAAQKTPITPTLPTNSHQNFRMISTPDRRSIILQVPPTSYIANYARLPQIQNSPIPILHIGEPIVNDVTQDKQKNASQQTTEQIETFTIPTKVVAQNNPVIVNAPKVLVIKQPSLRNDPLDMPESPKKVKHNTKQQNKACAREVNYAASCFEAESELEISDVEQPTEPEVIKRIIYNTKSVQTKFTCTDAICGLVETDGLKLNCFYCYEIFPSHKWHEFKQHIKHVHHIEEKENQLHPEAVLEQRQEKSTINNTNQVCKEIPTIDLTVKPLNTNTTAATTNTVKLPLEPGPLIERLTQIAVKQSKALANTLKNICTLETYVSDLKNSKQNLEKPTSTNHLDKSFIDDIISLDSDGGSDHIEPIADDDIENITKDLQRVKENVNNNSPKIDVAKPLPSSLQPITKKVGTVAPNGTVKSVPATPKPKQESLLKVQPKVNVQRVIKTEQFTKNGRTRPRYFVVKKVIKPAPAVQNSNMTNISRETMLLENSDEEMPSNDENEDTVPKPTKGRGILFGLTNPMVVIEFLLKLKSFPELWRHQLTKECYSFIFDNSIRKMCFHLNNRFDLNIENFEMLTSIQRVKKWYSRMLNEINEHNKRPNNTEPYKQKFPLYFKILNQFLSSEYRVTNNSLPNSLLESNTARRPVTHTQNISLKCSSTAPTEPSAVTDAAGNIKPTIETVEPDINMDNIIEFDPDTLYDQESSDEEVLEAFDETNNDGANKKRTKIYTGRYECDFCLKVFKRRCDLKRHRIHHFPPEYQCGVCEEKFFFKHWAAKCKHLRNKAYRMKMKQNLKQEDRSILKRIWPKKILKHKLICELCGASYRQLGSLNCHKRDKHFNQRLKCIVCHFTALTNYRIVQHQKKRHIVEPGTVEEVAKKSRARTETKTRFSTEARQEFDWRREMRKKLKPGEMFYACCKCRIIFNSRKEKVLHNKLEHPITDATIACLLCLPAKFLLSNSNSLRRHYTDIHKVPWDEIDALVKRTKPIFSVLSTEEIELLRASENYKELLEEFLKDRILERIEKVEETKALDETLNAVQYLPKEDLESTQIEENVYVDGIIDHDYFNDYNETEVRTEVVYDDKEKHEEEKYVETVDDFVETELVDEELIEEYIEVDEEGIESENLFSVNEFS